MVGGGSPGLLRKLQQEIISDPSVSYFNSNDHETSLTFVASESAVVLSPGFLNDHNPQFAWIPYDSDLSVPCVLCTHAGDTGRSVRRLVEMLTQFYRQDGLML